MTDPKESALRVRPGRAATEPPQELLARVAKRRRSLSHQQYVDGILKGQRTILAQANVNHVFHMGFNGVPADRKLARG